MFGLVIEIPLELMFLTRRDTFLKNFALFRFACQPDNSSNFWLRDRGGLSGCIHSSSCSFLCNVKSIYKHSYYIILYSEIPSIKSAYYASLPCILLYTRSLYVFEYPNTFPASYECHSFLF